MNNNNKKLYVIFEQIACRVVDVHEVGDCRGCDSNTCSFVSIFFLYFDE